MRALVAISVALLGAVTSVRAQSVERVRVSVVSDHPHDPGAFTQGLLLHEGILYESTGQYGESTVRAVNPTTGAVLRSHALAGTYFAEGLARVGTRLIQLTWKEHVAFVYDMATFELLEQFSYTGEGWGLCYDGTRLVMSDGSARLQFRDPSTFATLGSVGVTLDGQALERINELECVDGRVYANVWYSNSIVRIDPDTGVVDMVIDASGLLTSSEQAAADVLNGIAYDSASGTFRITGKYWPRTFVVRFGGDATSSDGASATGDSQPSGTGDARGPRRPAAPSGCFRAVPAGWPAPWLALLLVWRARGARQP